MIDSTPPAQLDHLALASFHAWDNVTRYCDQLGARWLGGPSGHEPRPFYFCQLEMAGGTKLELLEPVESPGSDFLRRFLHRNGPGPHHLTFKVAHLDDAIAAARAGGYEVVGIDRSEPRWQEAFLHPKQSHGIVVQLAQESHPDGPWPEPTELPPPHRANPPALTAVDHLVADLDAAVKLFTGPLAMDELHRWRTEDGDSATLGCGPWRLNLVQPARPSWQHWLGNRNGRLLRLHIELEEPATVPDARPIGGGRYEVPPERNLGTRLLLQAPGTGRS